MPFFLHSLKKSGRLEQIHITVGIVGSRKLVGKDDYGSQGWSIFAPNLTIYGFDADPEACKEANADVKAKQVSWTEKHIPLGLWSSEGKSILYVTQFPGCSSLYPPSEFYIKRFAGNSELIKLASTMEVETTTLDAFCQAEGVKEIDFIQLDIQGAELEVLKGGYRILASSTLAIITEVEFTELYTDQPLFSDLDVYLRQQGFTLLDLCHLHRDLRRLPLASKAHQGVLVWGDAFYFRDLIREDLNTELRTPDRILKLACLADVMDFSDYALELLTYLTTQYGEDSNYNFADNIIESLAQIPDLAKQGLSSLPIVAKVREYSNSYNLKSATINPQYILNNQANWQRQTRQCLLLGEYSQAAQLYEQAIEVEPDVKSHYWHLGLLLLLQGQEIEAQTTWFLGMAEAEPEQAVLWTEELIQVLQQEAERQQALGNDDMAKAIGQHITEMAPQAAVNRKQAVKYSHLDEESIIKDYLTKIVPENKYCVDIAASDGLTMSNTYFLFQQGWSGLAVEGDRLKFAALAHNYSNFPNVDLSKCMVTPENVVSLLKSHQVPEKFGLLNLDIDGYDYFVLEQILSTFRPSLICVEINEKIPPPLKFTVKWSPDYVWANDHFFGQSICQLNILCELYQYALVDLHYNNAFLIPKEISPSPGMAPEEAYMTGYLERPDRKQKFPWNADMEEIHNLSPQDALEYINKFFAQRKGKFDCYI